MRPESNNFPRYTLKGYKASVMIEKESNVFNYDWYYNEPFIKTTIFIAVRTLIILLLFFSNPCPAQDKLTIYFDVDKSKIKDHFKTNLNDLFIDYDNLSVDSIQYIGFSDTTGNVKSNMWLSERRARTVEKYCRKLFPEEVYTATYAKGEGTKLNDAENRKVEMIIHQKPQKKAQIRSDSEYWPQLF